MLISDLNYTSRQASLGSLRNSPVRSDRSFVPELGLFLRHSKYEASWDLPRRVQGDYFSLMFRNASTVSSYIFRAIATRAE